MQAPVTDLEQKVASLGPTQLLVHRHSMVAIFVRHRQVILNKSGGGKLYVSLSELAKTRSFAGVLSGQMRQLTIGAHNGIMDAIKENIKTKVLDEKTLEADVPNISDLVVVEAIDLACMAAFFAHAHGRLSILKHKIAEQRKSRREKTTTSSLILEAMLERESPITDDHPFLCYSNTILSGESVSSSFGLDPAGMSERLKDGMTELTLRRFVLMILGKFFMSQDSPRFYDHCWIKMDSPLACTLFRLNAAKQISCDTPILSAYHVKPDTPNTLLATHYHAMITCCEALFNSAHDIFTTTEDDTF